MINIDAILSNADWPKRTNDIFFRTLSGNPYHQPAGSHVGGQFAPAPSFPTSLTKVSGAMGSNPGGVYKDSDGQKWYVKHYRDPEQAYGEHLSNGIYQAAGINAPTSVLGEKSGEYASKWLDGVKGTLQSEGLSKETANKVLDGFVADVFLSNWDTVGLTRDNVAVHLDGSITRIDQGGTLLHRAQGALKPASALGSLSEWDFFSSGNKEYRDVFTAAGVKNGNALGHRAVEQIDAILKVRPNHGWSEFVDHRVPRASAAWKAKVSAVLETRHKLLLEKRDELQRRGLANPYHQPGGSSIGGEFAPKPGGDALSDALGTAFGQEFGEGTVSGDLTIIKKAKAPPATKEQIDTCVKMKENGSSYAEIEKATGLNPKQAATIYFKYKHGKISAKKAIWPVSKQQIEDAKKAQAIAKPLGELPSIPDVVPPATPPVAISDELALAGKGYIWQEKTTGPAKGKYAYFKNGVQVSANALNTTEGKVAAAASINFGKGPDYVAPIPPPPPPKPGTIKGTGLIGEYHGTASDPIEWPIEDSVHRKMGTTYLKKIQESGHEWSSKLNADERSAIKSYTGAGSQTVNAALRAGKKLSPSAQLIESGLAKASSPPPPELVWRGISAHVTATSHYESIASPEVVASLNSGDIISLKGFQSTSVSPDTAVSWSHGQTIFEIKPRRGAYVAGISTHSSEREFLLPHGAKYVVRGATMVTLGGHAGKRQIIQLEMLP